MISHPPYLIAAAPVNLVKDTDNGAHIMCLPVTGDLKSITCAAGSSSIMWQQILSANRDIVLTVPDCYMDAFAGVCTAL